MFRWSKSPVSYQGWNNDYAEWKQQSYTIYHVRKTYHGIEETTYRECSDPRNVPTCYIKENNTELLNIKKDSASYLQPGNRPSNGCTMLLMSNLAQPQWITIDCNHKVLSTVACVKQHSLTHSKNNSIKIANSTCFKSEFLNDNYCFELTWVGRGQLSRSYQPSIKISKSKKGIANICKVLSQAIYYHSLKFLVALQNKSVEVYQFFSGDTWMKRSLAKQRTSNLSVEGWLLKTANLKIIAFSSTITLSCSAEHYISTSSICDGNNDCTDNLGGSKSTDEKSCQCKDKYEGYCKELCTDHTCKCSPLYYKDKSGQCKSFLYKHTVRRNKNLKLNFTKLQLNMAQICEDITQLKCKNGESRCFNINDTCIYRLDTYGHITPCRTGSHLQECETFECNAHLKCPKFYCVPWGYTCDGKWDCPNGYDESLSCLSNNRVCSNMLKCKNSLICVHNLDICDGYADCPLGDDEILCELKTEKCFKECTCLNLAIMCENLNIDLNMNYLQYLSYHIIYSQVGNELFLLENTLPTHLNISHSSITKLCTERYKAQHLNLLDVSYNKIEKISKMCFYNLSVLIYVSVKHNNIHIMMPHSFYLITSLLSVDLSHNQLASFSKNAFKLVTILQLNLLHNPLFTVTQDLFSSLTIYEIKTNHFQMCCVKPTSTKCNAQKPWYASCSNLLPSDILKNILIVTSVSIIVANLASIILNTWKLQTHYSLDKTKLLADKSAGPYNITVIFVNFADLTCGLYFLMLWSADVYYGASFLVEEWKWRKSFLCSLAFFSATFLNLKSPVALSFLSLSRYMVVKNPFDSDFKSAKYVIKWLITLAAFLTFASVALVTVLRIFHETIPSRFCLPFVDPGNNLWEIKLCTSVVIFVQISAIVFITVIYISMLKLLKQSSKNVGQKETLKMGMVIQLLLLTGSNILCWIPSGIIYIVTLISDRYAVELLVWITVTAMPINSIINPIVFMLFMLKPWRCKPVTK